MATITRQLKNGMIKKWETLGNFRGGKIEKECRYCGKIFYVFPNVLRKNKGNYCSQSCARKAIQNAKGKHWKMPNGFGEKVKNWTSGNKNGNWQGGTSRAYKTGYWSNQYKKWRRMVFERDEYTCQVCGKKNCYLTAHHIKSFRFFPELRFRLSNGQTLCEVCHSLTDNYKGRARVQNY